MHRIRVEIIVSVALVALTCSNCAADTFCGSTLKWHQHNRGSYRGKSIQSCVQIDARFFFRTVLHRSTQHNLPSADLQVWVMTVFWQWQCETWHPNSLRGCCGSFWSRRLARCSEKTHGSDMQRLGNSVVAMAHGNDDAPECYLAIWKENHGIWWNVWMRVIASDHYKRIAVKVGTFWHPEQSLTYVNLAQLRCAAKCQSGFEVVPHVWCTVGGQKCYWGRTLGPGSQQDAASAWYDSKEGWNYLPHGLVTR